MLEPACPSGQGSHGPSTAGRSGLTVLAQENATVACANFSWISQISICWYYGVCMWAGKKAEVAEEAEGEAEEEEEEQEEEDDTSWEGGLTKASLKQEVLKILEGANMDEFNLKSLMKQLGDPQSLLITSLQPVCLLTCGSDCHFGAWNSSGFLPALQVSSTLPKTIVKMVLTAEILLSLCLRIYGGGYLACEQESSAVMLRHAKQ